MLRRYIYINIWKKSHVKPRELASMLCGARSLWRGAVFGVGIVDTSVLWFISIDRKPVTKNRKALCAHAAIKCLTARQPLPLLPTGWTWRWPTRSWRRNWDACGRWAPSRRRSSGKPRKSRLAQVSSRHVSMETRGRVDLRSACEKKTKNKTLLWWNVKPFPTRREHFKVLI